MLESILGSGPLGENAMKKMVMVIAFFLASSLANAESLKEMEERVRMRLREGAREFEKVCRGPLNAILVLYEKKPVEEWVERCNLEAFVRHAVSEHKRANLILEGPRLSTRESDLYYALERADTCAGSVESDAKALREILRLTYVPRHPDINIWLTLAGANDSNQKIFGTRVFELEQKLDFILKFELNLLANLAESRPEEGEFMRLTIQECAKLYFQPRAEAYELFKKTLEEKKELNRGEKIYLAKEIEKIFETSIAEIEQKLPALYREVKFSPMLRTWLNEGVKR